MSIDPQSSHPTLVGMESRRSISQQLREAVRRYEASRRSICLAIDLDPAVLSRFMNGTSGLSLESVDRLCAHLRLRLVGSGRGSRR